MMKKLFITLAAFICLMATTKAQTSNTVDGSYLGSIPGIFTSNGHPLLIAITDEYDREASIYDGNLTLVTSISNDIPIMEPLFMDADATSITISDFHNTLDHSLMFTQNLFDPDDEFEFLEHGNDLETSINIKSSNGTILQTIYCEEGYILDNYQGVFILKIDNNIYLVLRERQNGDSVTKHLFYLISQNEGLIKVDVDLPLSVFPTIPTREQQITVELGEGNNATEITVVNSLGQVVKQLPIEEGQRRITIPARELSGGLNVINARSPQGQGSCKIIVR